MKSSRLNSLGTPKCSSGKWYLFSVLVLGAE